VDDGTVTLLDRRGIRVQELDANEQTVGDLAVSPDGSWAATADAGGAVFRWDVDPATGRWSHPELLRGHHDQVGEVEVGPGGRQLFTVSWDQTAILWDMRVGIDAALPDEPSAWLDRACALVARDLTPAEWARHLPDRPYAATCTDLP